ncbi:MAG: response regulator [Rhizobiales bacterium]|nr:response regulator [Hyphomicrobiales bacterium]
MGAMPEMIFERLRHFGVHADIVRQPNAQAANLSLALIVCPSPINRIVVSRIAEQAGLKVVCETAQGTRQALFSRQPGLVILDCGPNHEELHPIAPAIIDHRRASGSRLPMLIVLSTKNLPADSPFTNIADVIIAKPITPDALQPKIEQLVEDARG